MGARQSPDTLLRQWTILRRIPRQPRRISTAELKSALAAEGLEVTVRTIQRDLEKLSAVFRFRSEQESRSNYWFWSERGNGIEMPGMSPATALTFLLARDYLTSLFPPATLSELLDAPARTPPGFDLERYIEEEGGFSYPLSRKPIKLRVPFDKGAAAHLDKRSLPLLGRG